MAEEKANSDEGASPENDLRAQNPGETTSADMAESDDPHKAEKLTKAGRDIDPNANTD